jgi:hypothetical protein
MARDGEWTCWLSVASEPASIEFRLPRYAVRCWIIPRDAALLRNRSGSIGG